MYLLIFYVSDIESISLLSLGLDGRVFMVEM